MSGRSRSSSAVSLNSGPSPPSQISHSYATRTSGFLRRQALLNATLPCKGSVTATQRMAVTARQLIGQHDATLCAGKADEQAAGRAV